MSANTKIEWCDSTFNPVIGCTKISPACDGCYAEVSTPARAMKIKWGAGEARHRTAPSTWAQPLAWNKAHGKFFAVHGRRRRVFCASLADVFDNEWAPSWRVDLFRLIESTPNLDWLLLTKRIGNARNMSQHAMGMIGVIHKPLPDNVWIGATIANQEEADRDIPKLLAVPARVRFLSMEPLLGHVNLGSIPTGGHGHHEFDPIITVNALQRKPEYPPLAKVDWIIAGGESGPGARPSHPDWYRSLRDQCAAAGVPFLFKQWGEWLPISQQLDDFTTRFYKSNRKAKRPEDQPAMDDCYGRTCKVDATVVYLDGTFHDRLAPMAFRAEVGAMMTLKVGKKAAGRLLDGIEHNGFPQ